MKKDVKKMTDRVIVDDKYNWIDTATDTVVGIDDLIDLVNKLHRQNVRLQDRIDKLVDDNEKYCLVHGNLCVTDNRFERTGCRTEIVDRETNRAYWLEHKKNVEGIVELLNHLNKEIKDYKDISQLLHEDMNYVKDLILEYGSEELVSKYINRWRI